MKLVLNSEYYLNIKSMVEFTTFVYLFHITWALLCLMLIHVMDEWKFGYRSRYSPLPLPVPPRTLFTSLCSSVQHCINPVESPHSSQSANPLRAHPFISNSAKIVFELGKQCPNMVILTPLSSVRYPVNSSVTLRPNTSLAPC